MKAGELLKIASHACLAGKYLVLEFDLGEED